MAKSTVTKEQVVRYEEWVNRDTGEVRQFAVIDKPYSSDYNFHKVWLEDLAKVLDVIGGAKIAVFNYILKNINPFSNEVGFTHQEITKSVTYEVNDKVKKVGRNTVYETVQLLQKADFMRKVRPATYRINPKMLIKGSHNKRVGIMMKYDELNNGKQLSLIENEQIEEWDQIEKNK